MKKFLFKVKSFLLPRGWIWKEGWYNSESDVKVFYPTAHDIREITR